MPIAAVEVGLTLQSYNNSLARVTVHVISHANNPVSVTVTK